ncbi:MAG TPA: O-succinylhomoserine sulfhydrylase [Burkholderiales bacterium]
MTEKATLGVRAGQRRTEFHEHSEALFLTSSFVFDSAEQAAARFSNAEDGYVYSRFTNPTVAMMQDRLAALEGAEACMATASGMAAILATVMSLLKAGDHIVCSSAVFGATVQLLGNYFGRLGIATTFVSPTKVAEWRDAVRPTTRLLFLETPSNPMTEVSDIPAIAEVAKKAGALLAVDNVFCTPILQRPLELGADLVIHSATKYLDGQGRVLGGAILGSRKLVMEQVFPFLRTAGPSLSPFNAWVILKGLETLDLRVRAQSAAALALAQWLERHPAVARVHYPGLESHPQHALAKRQQSAGGAVLSFELKGGPDGAKAAAWRVVNGTRLISITANLGDVKTTITHPATTTHGRISAEARAAAGITDGLLRIAVGLEALDDLKADLERGLS